MIDAAFRDRALYLPARDVLVCADLHLGRDATAAVQASLGERADITGRLAALCDRFSPTEVVLAGDVLHSFSGTPGDVAESFDAIVRGIESRGATVAITPGNHDAMLGGLWGGERVPEYRLGPGTGGKGGSEGDDGDTGGTDADEGTDTSAEGTDTGDVVVCHGHETPRTAAGTYVIGHDHPAIAIEGQRRPCYLYGPDAYQGADVLMVPAFTRLAAGVVVNQLRARDLQSPLVEDLEGFRPIVRDEEGDETLWFPPLGEFRSML